MTELQRLDTIQKAILRVVDGQWATTDAIMRRTAMYDNLTAMGIALGKLAKAGYVLKREHGKGRHAHREWMRSPKGDEAVA